MYEELYSDEYEAFIENEIDSISSSMLVESVGEIKLSDSRNTVRPGILEEKSNGLSC